MEKNECLQKTSKPRHYAIRSGLKAGYHPVHGLVAPDGWTKWTPGWYDKDSKDAMMGSAAAPPPPPE